MNDKAPPDWPSEVTRHLGKQIETDRKNSGLSAVRLSEALDTLGVPIHRVAIGRIEKGEQLVTVPELIALGIALEADWTRWLINAVEAVEIRGSRDRDMRVDLNAARVALEQQIATMAYELTKVTADIDTLQLPEGLREQRVRDRHRYQDILTSLTAQKVEVDRLLERSKMGHSIESDRSHDA